MSDESDYYDDEDEELEFDFLKKRKDSIEEDHSDKEEAASENSEDQRADPDEDSEEMEFQFTKAGKGTQADKAANLSNKPSEPEDAQNKLAFNSGGSLQKRASGISVASSDKDKTKKEKKASLGLFSVLDEISKKPDNRRLIVPDSPLSSEDAREYDEQSEKKREYSNDDVYEQHGDLSEDDEGKLLVELGKISKSLSLQTDAKLAAETAQELAKMRIKSPRQNTEQKELGSYFNKVSPKKFQQDFYEKAVKEFESRKERKIKKIKEENERKQNEELLLKPSLNHEKNKSIKMSHEQRLANFLSRKQKELDSLKKEVEDKRREEELKEVTFQPSLLAKKTNEKLVEKLIAKTNVKTASANQHFLSHIDGSNHKAHLCGKEVQKEETWSFKPSISKKSQEIWAKLLRTTSPDTAQRFEILEAQRREKLSMAVKQSVPSFKLVMSTQSKTSISKKPGGAKVFEISELNLPSKKSSPRQAPTSVRGGGSAKGFTSANKTNNQSPITKSTRKQGDTNVFTEDDVQRLLSELRGEKNENSSKETEPRAKTTKRNLETKAKEKEEINDLNKNIKSMQQNLEQLQDAFKNSMLKQTSPEKQQNSSPETNLSTTLPQTHDTSDFNMITPQKTPESKLQQQDGALSEHKNDLPIEQQKDVPSTVLAKLKTQMNYKGPSGAYRLPKAKI